MFIEQLFVLGKKFYDERDETWTQGVFLSQQHQGAGYSRHLSGKVAINEPPSRENPSSVV